jgi:hypothetical protein
MHCSSINYIILYIVYEFDLDCLCFTKIQWARIYLEFYTLLEQILYIVGTQFYTLLEHIYKLCWNIFLYIVLIVIPAFLKDLYIIGWHFYTLLLQISIQLSIMSPAVCFHVLCILCWHTGLEVMSREAIGSRGGDRLTNLGTACLRDQLHARMTDDSVRAIMGTIAASRWPCRWHT